MSRWKIVTELVAVLVAVGCTSSPDTGATNPAVQGAVQPEGGGAAMSESDACQAIRGALDQASSRLSCGTPALAPCPGYIRPSGGACLEYYQRTVDQCVKMIGAYTSCDDFANHPCYVTPIAGSAPQGCNAPPDAGADAPSEAGPGDSGADAFEAGPDAPPDAAPSDVGAG